MIAGTIAGGSACPQHWSAEPHELLDARHFAHLLGDAEPLKSLPAWCYTSPRFFDAEMERVFLRSWNVLDRAERIPRPGDFFCESYLGIPIIVVRGRDGTIRAFANSCRHRGTRLAEGEGSRKAFTCPYHAWSFSVEGELIGAPQFTGFSDQPLIAAENRRAFGLVEIPTATWGGFIFIKYRQTAETLEAHLGDLPQNIALAGYGPEDMVCTRRKVFELDCNWKLFVENFNEVYHLPYLHGTTLDMQKRKKRTHERFTGNYIANWAAHEGSRLILKGDAGFPAIPDLQGRYAAGTYYPTVLPGTMIAFSTDGMFFVRSEPVAANRSRLMIGSCFPKETLARNDFADIAKNYYHRIDSVTPEDFFATNLQQIGLASPYALPAELCQEENLINTFDRWIAGRFLNPPA